MDYTKVTMIEYQQKKKAIFDSLGRTGGICDGVMCNKCPFKCGDLGCLGERAEFRNPMEAIKLVMDYEIPVDWSKVKVDTPILVSLCEDEWYNKHFAKYENKTIYAFDNGMTSWTARPCDLTSWEYAKLAESEE